MFVRLYKKIVLYGIVFVGLVGIGLPSSVYAQFYGGPGMGGGMGGGMYGRGMYGGGLEGGGQALTVAVVKYGEKVYDAVSGELIDYKVQMLQVPAENVGKDYFDDGQNGDEVPYDGMPSYIMINNKSFLGPYSIMYKKQLVKLIEMTNKMGPLEFYRVGAATTDPNSKVSPLNEWNENLNGVLGELLKQLSQYEPKVNDMVAGGMRIEEILLNFDDDFQRKLSLDKRFKPTYDDETYIKSVDPSLYDSLTGGAGGIGGFGSMGYYPDLPTPPGLPKPNIRMGMPEFLNPEGGITPPTLPEARTPAPQSAQPNTTQTSGRFNPIQRARDAASTVTTRNQRTYGGSTSRR